MHKRNIILSILIISVLTVISGCTDKTTINNQTVVEPAQNPSGQSVVATSTDVDNEIDTSDWQTYQNEEHGIEFKYHDYWTTAATESGVTKENEYYLIDNIVLNNLDSINKSAYQILSFNIVNTENHSKFIPSDNYQKIDILSDSDVYYKESYFGHSLTAVLYKDNIELKVRLGNFENKDNVIEVMNEILNTIIFS